MKNTKKKFILYTLLAQIFTLQSKLIYVLGQR
jgi:membrane-anchored glycerophosphoryl diester phosphodiesterase (GDPDase)